MHTTNPRRIDDSVMVAVPPAMLDRLDPQVGAETAMLVPVNVWERLQSSASPTLKQLLLSEEVRGDLALPARGKARRRAPGFNSE